MSCGCQCILNRVCSSELVFSTGPRRRFKMRVMPLNFVFGRLSICSPMPCYLIRFAQVLASSYVLQSSSRPCRKLSGWLKHHRPGTKSMRCKYDSQFVSSSLCLVSVHRIRFDSCTTCLTVCLHASSNLCGIGIYCYIVVVDSSTWPSRKRYRARS